MVRCEHFILKYSQCEIFFFCSERSRNSFTVPIHFKPFVDFSASYYFSILVIVFRIPFLYQIRFHWPYLLFFVQHIRHWCNIHHEVLVRMSLIWCSIFPANQYRTSLSSDTTFCKTVFFTLCSFVKTSQRLQKTE